MNVLPADSFLSDVNLDVSRKAGSEIEYARSTGRSLTKRRRQTLLGAVQITRLPFRVPSGPRGETQTTISSATVAHPGQTAPLWA